MNAFIKRLIRHFQKTTSNQKGSVLSVSLIVVAILSLSITTLTGNTVNLSSATTKIQESMEDTSLSKKLIDVTIADLKTKLPDYAAEENPILAYFAAYSEDAGVIYTDENGVYDSPYIVHKDTGVIIKVDMNFEGMDYASQLPIKFTHSTLSKYIYFLIVPGSGLDGGVGNGAISNILNDPLTGDYAIWDEETEANYDADNYAAGDIVYAEGDYYIRTDNTKGNDNKLPWDYTGNGNGNGWFKDWVPYDGEVSQDGFDPSRDYEIDFYFSLVTNGDMYLNGGLYNIPSLFADNIYSSVASIYEYNNNFYSSVPNTTFNDDLYADFSEEPTKVFLQGDYNYCSSATISACVNIIESGDKVQFNRNEYGLIESSSLNADYYGAIQAVSLTAFFDAYNFHDELLNFVNNVTPSGFQMISDIVNLTDIDNPSTAEQEAYNTYLVDFPDSTITIGTWLDHKSYYELYVINNPSYSETEEVWIDDLVYDLLGLSNQTADECPTDSDFCNITPYSNEFLNLNNQDVSVIYNGNLTLTDSYNSTEDYTLIVLGDLTIDMSGDQSIVGNILVTGNTYFTGDSVRFQGTLITLGQTEINFNNNEGFYVNDIAPKNFTLLSRDNLIINSIYKTNYLDPNDNEFYGFLYTEESIYIDAVNSNINLHGSLYARATNALTSTDLPFVDETGAPINGIIINSIFGFLDSSGNINSYNNINFKDSYTRFIQQDIDDDFTQDQFSNLPWFQVGVQGEAAFIDDGFEEE